MTNKSYEKRLKELEQHKELVKRTKEWCKSIVRILERELKISNRKAKSMFNKAIAEIYHIPFEIELDKCVECGQPYISSYDFDDGVPVGNLPICHRKKCQQKHFRKIESFEKNKSRRYKENETRKNK